jgi:hypothetical protein
MSNLDNPTVVDTMAQSYLAKTSLSSGAAAIIAEGKKFKLYENLMSSNHFVPFAMETFGSFGLEALSFIKKIGSMLIKTSGDAKSKAYFIQRVSIANQRGNASSILGTVRNSVDLNEIFYL